MSFIWICSSQFSRTSSDGNCLFRACSIALTGNENSHKLLRMAVASELFLEACYYANHPHFLEVLQNHPDAFKDKSDIEVMSFSFKAFGSDNDSIQIEDIVRREAKVCLELFSWSSLVCVLAIPNVIEVITFKI